MEALWKPPETRPSRALFPGCRPWPFGSLLGSLPKGRSVIRVPAPIRPASTPDLATAWMAVVKSGVRPRQATFEAPMLLAQCANAAD
jgi:hypothetical protein